MNETITSVLTGKHPHEPPILRWRCTAKRLFYPHGHCGWCGWIGCTKTFGESRSYRYGFKSSTWVAFKIQGGQQKKITVVAIFVEWLVNQSPTWEAYHKFMSDRLISLDKQPGVCPVIIGDTWIWFFENCVMKVTGHEATKTRQDLSRIKSGNWWRRPWRSSYFRC